VSIQKIARVERDYIVSLKHDESIGIISKKDFDTLHIELGIEPFEMNRTHWAIKDDDLREILSDNGLLGESTDSMLETPPIIPSNPIEKADQNRAFIVHGHDEQAKNLTKRYVESRRLAPIILHQQAGRGMTIIEKIDHYSNVRFGIVLYTECDVGAKKNSLTYKWRARQNVVFEHGYLIGKLSCERVAAIVSGDVETPNDISGVAYITMDPAGRWKDELDKELRDAGYQLSID